MQSGGSPSKGDAMREEYDFSKGIQGPIVPPDPGKTQISIRLDNDVLDWFRDQVERAGSGSYQANINAALRAHMMSESGMLLDALRKVVREEMERGATKPRKAPGTRKAKKPNGSRKRRAS